MSSPMTVSEIFDSVTIWVERCNRPLIGGRRCCHVRGHNRTASGCMHSHTWHVGDSRYGFLGGHRIDLETGEIVGQAPNDTAPVIAVIEVGQGAQRFRYEVGSEAVASNARRILATMFNVDFSRGFPPVYAAPPETCDWHFESDQIAIGVDSHGHNVEFSFETGELRRIFSDNDRREVARYAIAHGAAEAARKYELSASTVRNWVRQARSR